MSLNLQTRFTDKIFFHNVESESGEIHRQAAVCLLLTGDSENPNLVLTERAQQLSSHPGEVALPGGKRDADDENTLATALRECEEEIGIGPRHIDIYGALDPKISKHGLSVVPYYGLIKNQVEYQPNPGELNTVFEVPIRYFMEDKRESTHEAVRYGQTIRYPVYRYNGYKIWGLTALIIVDFINLVFDAKIES